jgi:hypothetical protein
MKGGAHMKIFALAILSAFTIGLPALHGRTVEQADLGRILRQVPRRVPELRLAREVVVIEDRAMASYDLASQPPSTEKEPGILIVLSAFENEEEAVRQFKFPLVQLQPTRVGDFRGRQLKVWEPTERKLSNSYYQVSRYLVNIQAPGPIAYGLWSVALSAVVEQIERAASVR